MNITIGDLCNRYAKDKRRRQPKGDKAARNEANHLRWLAQEFATWSANRSSPARLATWAELRRQSVSAQTVKHDLNRLSAVLGRAQLVYRVIDRNIASEARAICAQTGVFAGIESRERRASCEEIDSVCQNSTEAMARLVRFAVQSCMRRQEIVGMRWEDVNLDRATLHIPVTKTGKARTIRLSKKAIALLDAQWSGDEDAQRSGDELVWKFQADTVTQSFNRACRAAGIVDLRFHDLRHEGISRLFEGRTFSRPLTIPEAQIISGHSTWSQLQRYTQLSAENLPL